MSTEMQTQSDDYNTVTNNINEADNDATAAIEASVSINGRMAGTMGLQDACGASMTIDSAATPKTITITYSGNNCAGTHARSGSIKVTLPNDMRWRNAGAAITVAFQNLTLTRLSDNKHITINGTQTLTNVSGGLLINLPTLQTIVHTITSSNMSITFDGGAQRSWNISRMQTFTYDNGVVLKVSGTGDVLSGSSAHLAEWGTNRFGHAFSTAIREALTFRQDCNGRLTAGEIIHEGVGTSDVTFGLNAAGEPTSCPGTGHYYLKLVWTGANGVPHTIITPY